MNNNQKAPKFRFSGLYNCWSEEELGEISIFNPPSELPDIFEYIDLESVQGTTILNHRTENKKTAPSRAQRLAQWGDIFYQTVRPYQKNNCLYELPYDNYVFSTDYAQIRTNLDKYFLFTYIQNEVFVSKVLERSTGTSYPSINTKDLSKIKIFFPGSYEEQTKIGEFFKQLDNIITLQQQLLNDHKQLKKAMLQKMFSQKGERVPKIRSSNFTEEWKEYKSKDIFCSVADKNHPNLPVLSASQKEGMVYRSDIAINIQYNKNSTKTYKRVVPGQFVIHLRSFQGGFAYSDIEGITSPAYTVIDFKNKDKQHTIFWKQILTSNIFIKQLETITYGIRDGRSISFTDFSTLKFRIPSYEEQEKISNFFNQLDETIILHENKLETYQNLKKAMLQKMFV